MPLVPSRRRDCEYLSKSGSQICTNMTIRSQRTLGRRQKKMMDVMGIKIVSLGWGGVLQPEPVVAFLSKSGVKCGGQALWIYGMFIASIRGCKRTDIIRRPAYLRHDSLQATFQRVGATCQSK